MGRGRISNAAHYDKSQIILNLPKNDPCTRIFLPFSNIEAMHNFVNPGTVYSERSFRFILLDLNKNNPTYDENDRTTTCSSVVMTTLEK